MALLLVAPQAMSPGSLALCASFAGGATELLLPASGGSGSTTAARHLLAAVVGPLYYFLGHLSAP